MNPQIIYYNLTDFYYYFLIDITEIKWVCKYFYYQETPQKILELFSKKLPRKLCKYY